MRRTPAILLLACIALMLPWSLKQIVRPVFNDFGVYFTAAQLVRQGAGPAIYDGADTGVDPQQKKAAPGSVFARTAAAHGIPEVMLYLYPPPLADALVPFTLLPFPIACAAWLSLSFAALCAVAALLARSAGWQILHWKTAALLLTLLLFRPVEWCLILGQVTVFLLLLWTLGIFLYSRGHTRASAVCLAIAAVIKLTPLLVVVPFLIWKEWRWLRWFAGTVLISIASVLCINGPRTLADFVLHVMPAMANGVVEISNLSLVAGVQMFAVGLAGGDPWYPPAAPHAATVLGKLLAALAVVAFCTLLFRLRNAPAPVRTTLLACTALVSSCVAPVAWRHAYTVAFLVLFFLWRQALYQPVSRWKIVLLVLFTLELNFVIDSFLVHKTHGLLLSVTPLLLPILSLAIVFTWMVPPDQPKTGISIAATN